MQMHLIVQAFSSNRIAVRVKKTSQIEIWGLVGSAPIRLTGFSPIANDPREGNQMKLYYSPGACSLSPHIALLEAGLPYDLVKVDLQAKKLENGDDYLKVNPKGQVPALSLDSGELVTEGPVIVQMIADKAAGKNLAPARDSAERYKLLEWLNYVTTELHKNFGPMFSPVLSDDAKAFFKDRVMGKFKYLESQLAGRDFLMGKQFTVADGYLFTMLTWADRMKFDLSAMPNLLAYKARVGARPKVLEALTKEGLMNAA
jgi:glutathione S-transferase